jgi:hypothetical protein
MPGVHVLLTGTMPLSSAALLGFPHLGTPTMIRVPPKESQMIQLTQLLFGIDS